MSMRNASHKRTVCEVLREINDMHQGQTLHDAEVRKRLAEAEIMAKKMSRKLLEYNEKIFADWWADNPEWKKKVKRRQDKRYCTG